MTSFPSELPSISKLKDLLQNNARLSSEHLNDVADLSKTYLRSEAIEFSEEDLLTNLALLCELLGKKGAKIKRADSEKLARIIISAAPSFFHKASEGQQVKPEGVQKAKASLRRFFGGSQSEGPMVSKRETTLAQANSLAAKADSVATAISPDDKKRLKEAYKLYSKSEALFVSIGEHGAAEEILEKMSGLLKPTPYTSNKLLKIKLAKKFLGLAKANLKIGEREKSAALIERAAEVVPGYFFENMIFDLIFEVFNPKDRLIVKAGNAYMKNGQYTKAAEYFYKHVCYTNAAKAYEKAGNFEAAANIYSQARKNLHAARLYESSRDCLKAGDCYRKYLMEREGPTSVALAQCLLGLACIPLPAAHPNDYIGFLGLAGFMLGMYGFFDAGIINEKYSITKRIHAHTFPRKWAKKAEQCYERHLDSVRESGDALACLHAYKNLSATYQSYNWRSNYSHGLGFSEDELAKKREECLSLASQCLLPALASLKGDPKAAVDLITYNSDLVAKEENLQPAISLLAGIAKSCEHARDILGAARLYSLQGSLLKANDPEVSRQHYAYALSILEAEGRSLAAGKDFKNAFSLLCEVPNVSPTAIKPEILLSFADLFYSGMEYGMAAHFYKIAAYNSPDVGKRRHCEHVAAVLSEFNDVADKLLAAKMLPSLLAFGPLEKNPRLVQIFSEEIKGKLPVFEKLNAKQMPEAYSRIFARLSSDYQQFSEVYLSGAPVSPQHSRFFLSELKRIAGADIGNRINTVCNTLKVAQPKDPVNDFIRAFGEINQKMQPPYAYPHKSVKRKFVIEQSEFNLPDGVNQGLRMALAKCRDSNFDNSTEAVRKKIAEATAAFQQGKAAAANLMLSYGVQQKAVSAYLEGKMDDENAMRLLVKNMDAPDLSSLAWKVIDRIDSVNPGAKAIFNRYCDGGFDPQAGGVNRQEKNELMLFLHEFDDHLQDYLEAEKLLPVAPKARDSDVFKELSGAKQRITESQSDLERDTREFRLLFSQNYRLLDSFFGLYAGECLSTESLARADVVNATLFQNDELAGGVLLLMRNIYGKKSMVVIGVDPSIKVVGGISTQKAQEISDWMLSEVHSYAKDNGFKLYITSQIGGITNRGGTLKLSKYFGFRKIPVIPTNMVGSYTMLSVSNFVLPKKNSFASRYLF